MKKYRIIVIILFLMSIYILESDALIKSDLSLFGQKVVIDVGHGGRDPGTSYNNVVEKEINLQISLILKESLIKKGMEVLLTREKDYDLSTPNTMHRKRSDFDNRIKIINESDSNLYLSIHQNYLSDSSYYGPQVFYNNSFTINQKIAQIIQNNLNKMTNSKRKIKKIPTDNYMYKKLTIPGVLIECGFLSNNRDRQLLQSKQYQQKIVEAIIKALKKIN